MLKKRLSKYDLIIGLIALVLGHRKLSNGANQQNIEGDQSV